MESYVSCIKIRGMPILPPLMTDDCRMEMNYYKKLALAVEDKLKKLRIANNATRSRSVNNVEEEHHVDDETSDTPHTDRQSNASTITYMPARNESFKNKINFESTDGGCKIISNNDTITTSTDSKFINISDFSKTDITEIISDVSKPTVPKTLDIIPITVETSNILEDKKISSESEESENNIPKLVRQGSYTLDSPSPMLLAHLEHSQENYVPTPVTNGVKRRMWNSLNAKVEWKYQRTTRDSTIYQYSSENEILSSARRNSISGCESKKGENGSACGKNECQLVIPKRQVVRSADCIPTLISREYTCGSSKVDKRNIFTGKSSSTPRYRNADSQKCKTSKDISNINLVKKFGGSLGALCPRNSRNNRKITQSDNNRITKSIDVSSTLKNKLMYSPEKLKPVVMSEKLIKIFKEIQKTHEQQMGDLMIRQEKEQIMMQQEFQKQQLILLSKIEKSFPGVTLPLLANKITVSTDDNFRGRKSSLCNSISLPKSVECSDSQNSTKCSNASIQNHSDPETSPINGSSFESDESISLKFNTSTHEPFLTELNMSHEIRKSNVSRELFPLVNNAIHVPVTNGYFYDERHIHAATVINAYVRGYLVRRLMKTERVITLKNTYKEALHCMLKLHVDAPLELSELNFHNRLQHQCDAASINIVELFSQNPEKKMEIIAQDRHIKKARQERPNSARSYSFATQRTLARKRYKEMGIVQMPESSRNSARTRCQTWTSNPREKRSPGIIHQGLKRSTSAGAVRKPWR